MFQPNNKAAILLGLQQFGPAPGAKKMMTWEYEHAKEAIESGFYVTFYNNTKHRECSRIGSNSICFCGHFFPSHDKTFIKKKLITKCNECPCKAFKFMFRRPEEVGMYWLPRRKNFDINKWHPSCKCKHNHLEHDPVTLKCNLCTCFLFQSDFACLGCDCF